MTYLDKYKVICKAYKLAFSQYTYYNKGHLHHIKPKSIYPKLKDDYENIIKVHPLVHAALHLFLSKAYENGELNERFKNIVYADVVGFINSKIEGRKLEFNESNADEVFNMVVNSYIYICEKYQEFINLPRQNEIYVVGTSGNNFICKVLKSDSTSYVEEWMTYDELLAEEKNYLVFRTIYKNIEGHKHSRFKERAVKLERFEYKTKPDSPVYKIKLIFKNVTGTLNYELDKLLDSCSEDPLDDLDSETFLNMLTEISKRLINNYTEVKCTDIDGIDYDDIDYEFEEDITAEEIDKIADDLEV